MKRCISLLLTFLLALSLFPAASGETGGDDVLVCIRANAHMKLEDAEKLLKDAPDDEDTKALRALVGDLARCEGVYIQEKDEGEYETYTAKLEIWLEKGEPRCSMDYENYIGFLYRYPASVERAEEVPWLFHTEPSDGEQQFLVDFNENDMRISWADGVCEYNLHRWSGDPQELENTPFEETEDYDFIVSVLTTLLQEEQQYSILYDDTGKTLTMYFCDERLSRQRLQQNLNRVAETLSSMEETMVLYSDAVQEYLDICLNHPPFGASCAIAFVDHLRADGNYSEDDLILKAVNGKTVYSIAGNAKSTAATPKPSTTPTVGERNALKTAKKHLEYMPCSYQGLVKQLEYEGYTHSQAVYGADHCGANWKTEAAAKAKLYLETFSFSYQGLVEQLEYEGFTHEQAVYGADRVYR